MLPEPVPRQAPWNVREVEDGRAIGGLVRNAVILPTKTRGDCEGRRRLPCVLKVGHEGSYGGDRDSTIVPNDTDAAQGVPGITLPSSPKFEIAIGGLALIEPHAPILHAWQGECGPRP